MHQWPRRLLALVCSAFFLTDLADWGGPWAGAFSFVLGVSVVVVELFGRRDRKDDELTSLNIHA